MGAFIPMEDLALLEKIEDMVDLSDAKAALKDIKKNSAVSWEVIKRKIKL